MCESAAGPCRDVTGGSAGAQRLKSALFASLPRGDQKASFPAAPAHPEQPEQNPLRSFYPLSHFEGENKNLGQEKPPTARRQQPAREIKIAATHI